MMKHILNSLFLPGLFLTLVVFLAAAPLQSLEKNQKVRDDGAPRVGEAAPVFKLKSLDGKDEFDLASFRDKKPVVLFFGSYT